MFRRLHYCWLFLACAVFLRPAFAEMPPSAYEAVTVQARVVNRLGKPVAGLPVRMEVGLQGVALEDDGEGNAIQSSETRTVRTDMQGVATLRLSGLPWTQEARWFRGRVSLTASLVFQASREVSPLGTGTVSATEVVPSAETTPLPTLAIEEEPDRMIDGFPVWSARNGSRDKVVVCLEGFDLYNRISASDLMQIIDPATDALRAHGVSVLIVHFPDSHLPPDKLAPRAAEAIAAAARDSGHEVAVAGLSAGGVIGRWALVDAEQRGEPLPVNTFLTLDSPNRGARMNPQLQALILRYGFAADKAALASEAAGVLLSSRPAEVQWKWIGLPLLGRAMPVSCREDSALHDAFYVRLRQLNDHNGYPKHPRLVGVSSGSRRGGSSSGALMRLWVPFTYGWTLPAATEDHAPGSLLPTFYVDRFTTVYPLGLAGATLRSDPTFIPTESALDAGPEDTPPFDAWYARPDNAPAIAHDRVASDEAAFVVRQLLESDWASLPGPVPAGQSASAMFP